MKKSLIFVVALALSCVSFAQFKVGLTGSFSLPGFSTTVSEADYYNLSFPNTKLASESFSVSPSFGYRFSDNMEVGLSLFYQHTTSKGKGVAFADVDVETGQVISSSTTYNVPEQSVFGLAPYFRFDFVSYGSLRLFAQLNVAFAKGTLVQNRIVEGTNTTSSEKETMKAGIMAINAYVVPGISYEVTDHISFDVYMNFVSLGFSMMEMTYESVYSDMNEAYSKDCGKETYSVFGLNAAGNYFNGDVASSYNLTPAIGVGMNVVF